jgi:DNA replication protein DnaC
MHDDIGFDTEKYFKGCPDCGGTGFKVTDNISTPCTCWKRDRLKTRLLNANIPEEYIHVSLAKLSKDIEGNFLVYQDGNFKSTPINIQSLIRKYIFNLHNHVGNTGLGLLMIGSTGVGKTFMGALILKNALWYSVFRKSKEPEVAEKLSFIRNADVIVLDEVGAEVSNAQKGVPDFYRSEMDDLLRFRSNNLLPTIMTTNLTAQTFKESYKQYNTNNLNRVWSIIQGRYFVVEVCSTGDYRNKLLNKQKKEFWEKVKK